MSRREQTCCFTGHRPEKLPWGRDESDPRCLILKQRLRDVIEESYRDGMRHFICGMARGCDFYFAEAVLELRRSYPEITLEAAIPCASQSHGWRREEQLRWQRILAACDLETLVQERYDPGCMLRRNRYMVDHSALVIAVYDGSDGGTRRTLEYAIRQKVPFLDLNPEVYAKK